MGLLDEILGKIVDIQVKAETGQLGAVNVKTENKAFNFNFHFSNPETAKAFAEALITPELQKEIKEETRKRLEPIAHTLEMVSDSTAVEFVAATTGLSALEALKEEGEGTLTMKGETTYIKNSK